MPGNRTATTLLVVGLLALACGGLPETPRPYTPSVQARTAFREPTEVILFAESESQAAAALGPYLEALGGVPGVTVTVRPPGDERARDLGVRYGGTLVLVRGDRSEPIPLGGTPSGLCESLPVLDDLVRRALARLDQEPCDAVVVPEGALDTLARAMEGLGHPVRAVAAEAFASERACLVVARGPLPAASQARLREHLAAGGDALLLVGPQGGLALDALGSAAGTAWLADDKLHVRLHGDRTDRRLVGLTDATAHAATSTLTRSTSSTVVAPDAVALAPGPGATVLLRSSPASWIDADGDLEPDPDEERGARPVAMAVETTAGGRAVVIGSLRALDDDLLGASVGNQFLGMDALRWLYGEDAFGPEPTPGSAAVADCLERLP